MALHPLAGKPAPPEMLIDVDRLCAAYQKVADAEYAQLRADQRRLLDNALRDFRLAGVALPPERKQRFGEVMERLAIPQPESGTATTLEEDLPASRQENGRAVNLHTLVDDRARFAGAGLRFDPAVARPPELQLADQAFAQGRPLFIGSPR